MGQAPFVYFRECFDDHQLRVGWRKYQQLPELDSGPSISRIRPGTVRGACEHLRGRPLLRSCQLDVWTSDDREDADPSETHRSEGSEWHSQMWRSSAALS
jgi:hypothetical protein